jgi:NAD(P)-dependent dehydrogenase (short-subunit alcohol dehydrogenase family)
MKQLEGKVALVTGAGRGLGRACANLFAREGAKVVIAERETQNGEEAAQLIRDDGGEAVFCCTDIAEAESVKAMVAFALDSFGRLDCAVNVTGTFLCMKYEIRAMLETGGGAIVNIGSGRENTGEAGLAWYLGAKQAIYGMTKCAALDYGDKGIRINAVAPGPMWTPMLRETAQKRPGHLDQHLAHIPMRRIGEPEEVAEAAVWLCSPRASYIHGALLSADGGYVLG